MLKARPTDRPPAKKYTNYIIKAKKKNSIFNFAGNLIKKNILKMFVVIFVMLVVIVIFTPFFVNLRVWKPEIVVMLEDLTNKQASIEGDISLNILGFGEEKVHGDHPHTEDLIRASAAYDFHLTPNLGIAPTKWNSCSASTGMS